MERILEKFVPQNEKWAGLLPPFMKRKNVSHWLAEMGVFTVSEIPQLLIY